MKFNKKVLLLSSVLFVSSSAFAQQTITYTTYTPQYQDGYDSYYENGTTYYYSDPNSTVIVTDRVPVYPKQRYYYYQPQYPQHQRPPHNPPPRPMPPRGNDHQGRPDGIYIRN